jgi:hypothetical protein
MITLASVILGINYYEEGYKLEDIGIANMSSKELRDYLQNGI